MTPEQQTQLDDLERISGFSKDLILQISQDVAWLRETTCRRTPPALPNITRAETDEEASMHYYDGVTATLVALREKGFLVEYDAPRLIPGTKFDHEAKPGSVTFVEEPFAEHAPKSASDFI